VEAGTILWKVDSSGNKVFYNVPGKDHDSSESTAIPTFSKKADSYQDLISDTCEKQGVDPQLVKSIIQVESAYDSNAVSRVGAAGLMQLMPATAARFGIQNSFDLAQNVLGGVRYLKTLIGLFPDDMKLVVAAYNAGEHTVQRYDGIPQYPETQNYV